jgi:predicted TIM-barrel fold metal-dependent hydrolase
MKIIDANCGIGPWGWRDPLLPGTVAETAAILDSCGIERALAYSNLARTLASDRAINAATLAAAAADSRWLPAGVLTPRPYAGDPAPAEQVRALCAAGMRAAWLFPLGQQHGLWPWLIGGLLAECVARRLPVFVSVEKLTPNDIWELGRQFPALRLVLCNLGYRADGWLFPLLRQYGEMRVCLGHTYIPPGAPERLVREFGARRVLFGSGLPEYAPGGLLGMVMYARLSDADKARILAGNLEQLLAEVQL